MPLNPFRASRNRTTTVCAIAFFAICVWFTAWQEPLLEQRGFVFALMLCVFGAALFVFARLAFALVLSGGLFLLLRAITVLNGVSGKTRAHVEQAAAVASGRCRAIVKVPWDSHLKRLTQERSPDPSAPRPAGGRADTLMAAPVPDEPVLSPALTHAYTALAGVLVASLAGPNELRSARL